MAPAVRVEAGAPGTLTVSGELVFDSAAQALARAESLLQGADYARLDLAGVSAADSAGLACVVAMMAASRQRGGRLRAVNLPPGLQALARVCEVDALLV